MTSEAGVFLRNFPLGYWSELVEDNGKKAGDGFGEDFIT